MRLTIRRDITIRKSSKPARVYYNTPLNLPWKFYIRRNNNKVDSIEIVHIVITHFLPWSNLEKCLYTMLF